MKHFINNYKNLSIFITEMILILLVCDNIIILVWEQ